jgi:hypothetical protein
MSYKELNPGHPACSLVTIQTELPWLLKDRMYKSIILPGGLYGFVWLLHRGKNTNCKCEKTKHSRKYIGPKIMKYIHS